MRFFNPLDRLLRRSVGNRFLILWNRGLGDVPLGLYALVQRIREYVPDASITFLTRGDLADVFAMLPDVNVVIANWKRGETPQIPGGMRDHFDVVIEKPNPTKWLKWQLKTLTPKLHWDPTWDHLSAKFDLKGKDFVGMHISSETGQYYGYEKNWPRAKWDKVIKECKRPVILFGLKKEGRYPGSIDLRGETTLFEMLSIIKNHCTSLIAPDSGVFSVAYYLDVDFPLRAISLWADPRQGVLRQGVRSPNPSFDHIPLFGSEEKVENIEVEEVLSQL